MPGLIILAALLGGGFLCYLKLKRSVRRISRQAFGTDSLIDGYKKQKRELSQIPKSVCAMTRVYLPQILRDFPEFNYEQFKIRAENMLRSALSAISSNKAELLINASSDLKEKLSLVIEENVRLDRREAFEDVKIHQTEITSYKKQSGTCVITLQSSVGHLHYITAGGKLIEGDKEIVEQVRYNTDLVYIQDLKKVGSSYNNAVGTSCPNCGAPITNLGAKACEYCGMAVSGINVYVWAISDYKKI